MCDVPCVLTIAQHRFILINFLLFSAAVQFCKGAIQIPHCDCDCDWLCLQINTYWNFTLVEIVADAWLPFIVIMLGYCLWRGFGC